MKLFNISWFGLTAFALSLVTGVVGCASYEEPPLRPEGLFGTPPPPVAPQPVADVPAPASGVVPAPNPVPMAKPAQVAGATSVLGTEPVTGKKKERGIGLSVMIDTEGPAPLPPGSRILIRIFDSLLADVSVSSEPVIIQTEPGESLPLGLLLELDEAGVNSLAGPAISVRVEDANGHLLYINDTIVRFSAAGPQGDVRVPVIRIR